MFTASLYFVMPMVFGCWLFSLGLLFFYYDNYFDTNKYLYYMTQWSRLGMAAYLGYIALLDSSSTTGTRTPHLRNFRDWWGHACDYLPLLLVKTADLPADQNYVLGYHPHGIISVGAFCAFATDSARTLDLTATTTKTEDPPTTTTTTTTTEQQSSRQQRRGFSSLFPGIDRRILTLRQNFTTPFLREYFLWMGACESSKEAFRNILGESGSSSAVVVVVGGAAESLMVQEGCMDLILQTRRGFVREAIMAGAHLVPVLGFGESDLYHVIDVDETSIMARIQRTVKQLTGMAMPMFRGRSVFLRNYGIMAKRTPVCVVVGAPIAPPKLEHPNGEFAPNIDRKTDEALNEDGKLLMEWHAKYVAALTELEKKYHNATWNIPGQNRKSDLRIVK
jgi:2-acylglycerol O-acyltransferase 2